MFSSLELYALLFKVINFVVVLAFVGVVIFVHEFGHYFFSRLFGVAVPTFSIGMGPRLLAFKAWGTEFILAAFPVGGYVQPKDTEENDPEDPTNNAPGLSFHELSYWKKMVVLLAGITSNFLLAGFLFAGYSYFNSVDEDKIVGLKVSNVQADSPAQAAGLIEGDEIIGFANREFNGKDCGFSDYKNAVQANLGKSLKIKYKRSGEVVKGQIYLRDAKEQIKQRGAMGVVLEPVYSSDNKIQRTILQALVHGFVGAAIYFQQNLYGIYSLIANRSISGIDGVGSIISGAMALGVRNFAKLIRFFGAISIGLAVINVLPISPMDGGRVAVVTIEAILGRRKIWLVRKIAELMSYAFMLLALFVLAMDFYKLGTRTMVVAGSLITLWILNSFRE